jgi:hypothetical protein
VFEAGAWTVKHPDAVYPDGFYFYSVEDFGDNGIGSSIPYDPEVHSPTLATSFVCPAGGAGEGYTLDAIQPI